MSYQYTISIKIWQASAVPNLPILLLTWPIFASVHRVQQNTLLCSKREDNLSPLLRGLGAHATTHVADNDLTSVLDKMDVASLDPNPLAINWTVTECTLDDVGFVVGLVRCHICICGDFSRSPSV